LLGDKSKEVSMRS
jgi:hypothetical protein